MRSVLLTALLSTTAFACLESIFGLPGNSRLDYCDDPSNHMVDITSVNIKTGSQKVVTITGKAKTDIPEGAISSVSFKVPFFGGPGQDFSFCKDLGVKCPVAKGDTFTATHKLGVKFLFPESNYQVKVNLIRAIAFPPEVMLCVDGPWKAGSSSLAEQDRYEVQWPMAKVEEREEMK